LLTAGPGLKDLSVVDPALGGLEAAFRDGVGLDEYPYRPHKQCNFCPSQSAAAVALRKGQFDSLFWEVSSTRIQEL
jgi:hypothetical protein